MINGWTGNILRINLTTGAISRESSSQYKSLIGGMGFGYKIMYEEVAPGVKPFDEENKVVFAVGPLTGSGAPCSSRVNITSLSTFTRGNLVVDAHMGGFFAAWMKFAGYDALIIEGQADNPVWIHIDDDQVSIEDASFLWGKGTRQTTEELCAQTSPEACVAAIGPAGENLVPLSGLINSRNHSGGAGIGAVLGAKKLKAIVVEGSRGVNVADRKALKELNDYMMTQLIGANNNHVVPSTPQSWAEYSHPGSRWTARKGLYWGAAEGGPIETGEIPPGNANTVGFRTMKSTFDLGPEAEQYTVKMGDATHALFAVCHNLMSRKQKNLAYLKQAETLVSPTLFIPPFSLMARKILRKKAMPMLLVILSASIFLMIWAYGATTVSFIVTLLIAIPTAFLNAFFLKKSITIFLGINLKKVIPHLSKISITA